MSWRWMLVSTVLPVLIVLFARPFLWPLSHLPVYRDMRNPGWFATAMPSLALLLLAALGGRVLLQRIKRPQWRAFAVLVFAGVAIFDVWAYRDAFDHQLEPGVVAELREVGAVLDASSKPGRVMSRESYNPNADLLQSHTDRSAAFYWLNWMAPQRTSQFMLGRIYQLLHRPETIALALRAAGQGHVRYVLYDLREGPPPPPTEMLQLAWRGENYALYENMLCQPFAYCLGDQAAPEQTKGSEVSDHRAKVRLAAPRRGSNRSAHHGRSPKAAGGRGIVDAALGSIRKRQTGQGGARSRSVPGRARTGGGVACEIGVPAHVGLHRRSRPFGYEFGGRVGADVRRPLVATMWYSHPREADRAPNALGRRISR